MSDAYADHVARRYELRERLLKLDKGWGALTALVEALENGAVIFWTGSVVVEFPETDVPAAEQAMMVLDADDFDNIKWLTEQAGKTA